MIRILFLSFIFLYGGIASAQSSNSAVKKVSPRYRWTLTDWDQDAPYREARRSIDTQIQAGVPASTIAAKLDQPNELNDALRQFKWGYATYEAARKSGFPGPVLQTIKERVNFSLRKTTPRSAEFARLLFLLGSHSGADRRLADVGQRLVKQYPNDFEVKWFTFYSLSPGRRSHFPIAIAYAKDLKRKQPDKPEAPFLLARVYTSVWATTWERKDANRAIAEYKSILKELPANDTRRQLALSKMKWIRDVQPTLEQKKELRPNWRRD